MGKLEKAWSYIYDIPLKICCANFQLCYIFFAKIYLCEEENFKSMKNFLINITFFIRKKYFFCLSRKKKVIAAYLIFFFFFF